MAKRILGILLLVMLQPWGLWAQEAPQVPEWRNSLVVLIGGSVYDHAPNLDFVDRDLEAMKSYAIQGLGVPAAQVHSFRNPSRLDFEDIFLNGGFLDQEMQRLGGNLLLYVSGHGVPDSSGAPAFLPSDGRPNVDRHLYPQAEILAALERLRHNLPQDRQLLALFDACFSGETRQGQIVQAKAPPIRAVVPAGVARFMATRGDTVAYADKEAQLSAFTSAFLRAVSGQADDPGHGGNGDGAIDTREVLRFVNRSLPQIASAQQQAEADIEQDFLLPAYTVPQLQPLVAREQLRQRWRQLALEQAIRPGQRLPGPRRIARVRDTAALGAMRDKIYALEDDLLDFEYRCGAVNACEDFNETMQGVQAAIDASIVGLTDHRAYLQAQQDDPDAWCRAYESDCQRLQTAHPGYDCLHSRRAERQCAFLIPPEVLHDQGLLDQARASGARADWQACAVGCKLADNRSQAQAEVQRLHALEAARRAAEREAQRQAQQHQDDRAWQRATAGNTVADYRAYVRDCQLCSHKTEAQHRIDALSGPETFRDCPSCPLMTVIPAGGFMMGSNNGDSDEKPVHEVEIGKPFAMGVYEVTFDEWDACVSDGYCQANKRPDDEGWGRGKHPVINVSWDDITASGRQGFIAWLNSKVSGSPYRLPSEAEWEYAARAGSQTKYWWGDADPVCQRGHSQGANFFACNSNGTEAVGFSRANAFGLYDVHGNVWEWVQDCWNEDYKDGPRTQAARATGDCRRRVQRGGSWIFNPNYLRSANRVRANTDLRDINNGFRIAKPL